MSGVFIKYGDVAVNAKENFIPNISDKEDFVNINELQKNIGKIENYSNPCDLYSTLLDGNSILVPNGEKTDKLNLGVWSNQTTDEDHEFETPILLTLVSAVKYSSPGITLTFDTYNNIYPESFYVQWYRDDVVIESDIFYPDNAEYFCNKKVEYYNKIQIIFENLNMPHNRLRINNIEYGIITKFDGDELRSVKIIQEIDPITSEIAINTCDFTIESKKDINYTFQNRQQIMVYFDEELKSLSFVKSAKRKSKSIWDIESEDYIGILDNVYYHGGIYNKAIAKNIINDIFSIAKVPYTITNEFENETVTGYIPYTTCRNALMQILFAINAVVDTTNSLNVDIFKLEDSITQTIPLERILNYQNFDYDTKVTSVEVTAHSYLKGNETIELYNASESGEGSNIFVKFSEPIHNLQISNGNIIEYSSNHALINANTECTLSGKKYIHNMYIKSIQNPDINSTDTENIITISNATLVSPENIDIIVEKCYNFYNNIENISTLIVEGKHEIEKDNITEIETDQPTKVGDLVEMSTEYMGNITKRIIKQSFNLNGRIIVKDSTLV